MTFRGRLVVATTVAVVIAVLLACLGAYLATQNSLLASLDATLEHDANVTLSGSNSSFDNAVRAAHTFGAVLQIVTPSGQVIGGPLPVTSDVQQVASGKSSATSYKNVTVDGDTWREIVAAVVANPNPPVGPSQQVGALQLATPLKPVDDQLAHLRLLLALVAAGGVALAILLGWLVGRTALRPLNTLTENIEDMAETTDGSRRLDAGGVDELGRLRRAFNRLLEALDRSREQQRTLVLDASHELRTPLTSLRTNMEVARRLEALPEEDRQVLVDDVVAQMDELTNLVGDMAELARGEHQESTRALLRLDQLVEESVALATTHGRSKNLKFSVSTEPTTVVGHPERIARAVGNLLDNAVKWSPPESTIEVSCHGQTVTVRDHGPGIDPADLPHVFDRFYRAPAARSLPGSGLGLAIVAQVASEECASVSAANAADGGAVFRLEFRAAAGATSAT